MPDIVRVDTALNESLAQYADQVAMLMTEVQLHSKTDRPFKGIGGG